MTIPNVQPVSVNWDPGLGAILQQGLGQVLAAHQAAQQQRLAEQNFALEQERAARAVEYLRMQQAAFQQGQQDRSAIGVALPELLEAPPGMDPTAEVVRRAPVASRGAVVEALAPFREERMKDAALKGALERKDQALGKIASPDRNQRIQGLFELTASGATPPSPLVAAVLEQASQDFGITPQEMNAARGLMSAAPGKVSFREALSILGKPLPAGVNGDFYAPPRATGAGGARGAQQTKLKGLWSSADAANTALNVLLEQNPGGVKLTTQYLKDTNIGQFVLSGPQQQMVQSIRQFAQMWRLFVSGQAATDREYQDILRTAVPVAGDKPATQRQKQMMRKFMLDAIAEAAGLEQGNRVAVLRQYRDRLRDAGFTGPDLTVWDQAIRDAEAYDANRPGATRIVTDEMDDADLLDGLNLNEDDE